MSKISSKRDQSVSDATKLDRKSKSKPNSRRRSSAKARPDTGIPSNKLLSQATYETAISSGSTVFPSDCASMQAAGNLVNVPGQDNFIADSSRLMNDASATERWALDFTAQTKRTCNAMVLGFTPYFGSLDTDVARIWMSPIRQAALNLKQFVDTSFGTNTNYDPQDLMLYLMAVAAVFPVIAEIKRNLRLVLTAQTNVYPSFVPTGLFASLGLSDSEMHYSRGEGAIYSAQSLRSWVDSLNQIILAFNRLPIPPELTVFGINDDLFDAIWADSEDTHTAQLYLFMTTGYWIYSEEETDLGATLKYERWDEPKPIGTMIAILRNMVEAISALRTSSTAMLQNLYNAYGSADTIQIPTVDINALAPLEIVYNQNILTSIENATLATTRTAWISNIQADSEENEVTGHVYISDGDIEAPGLTFNLPLQFHKPVDTITADDIGYAMRFHTAFLTRKKIKIFTDSVPSGTEIEATVSDGFTGFAILNKCAISSIGDSGEIIMTNYSNRSLVDATSWMRTLDFNAAPLFVHYNLIESEDYDKLYRLNYYTGKRDVELNYRKGDMQMFWNYLTQTAWAANVNRNVTGSRAR